MHRMLQLHKHHHVPDDVDGGELDLLCLVSGGRQFRSEQSTPKCAGSLNTKPEHTNNQHPIRIGAYARLESRACVNLSTRWQAFARA